MFIEILGLLFSIIVGIIGHFLYNWSNKNKVIGYFFATDESIFQHLKLGITPIMLWTIIEFLTIRLNNVFFAKFISIIIFIIILLILYYGYKIVIKHNVLFFDISIFYISLTISYLVSIYIINNTNNNFILNIIGLVGFVFVNIYYKVFNKY